MFYFVGYQPHCHTEHDGDGLQTTHSSLDKMLVCSDQHAALPSSPPNKPCSCNNTAASSGLTGKSTEQMSQVSPVIEENTGKSARDHGLAATLGVYKRKNIFHIQLGWILLSFADFGLKIFFCTFLGCRLHMVKLKNRYD